MFEALGLAHEEDRIYRAILLRPGRSDLELSRSVEVPLDEVQRIVADPVDKGLIRRQGGVAEIVADGPEAVLEERVAEADLEAAHRRRQAAAVRRQIGPLLSFCWNAALPLGDQAPPGPVAAVESPTRAERRSSRC